MLSALLYIIPSTARAPCRGCSVQHPCLCLFRMTIGTGTTILSLSVLLFPCLPASLSPIHVCVFSLPIVRPNSPFTTDLFKISPFPLHSWCKNGLFTSDKGMCQTCADTLAGGLGPSFKGVGPSVIGLISGP